MRNLITYVHVVERDEHGNAGRSQTFGPGDVVPGWARKAITNPNVWDRPEPPVAAEIGDDDDQGGGGDDTPVAPPRSGAGSGTEAWAAYAAQFGYKVPADAKREDIIADLEEAGHIQKPEA